MKSTIRIILIALFGGVVLAALLVAFQILPLAVALPSSETSITDTQVSDTGTSGGVMAKSPQIQVEEKVYHFGSMEQGTSLTHAFQVRNTGDSSLHIKVGSTTCKCTVGGLSAEEVAPGEQAEVTLEWTAKTSPGPFRHGATLITNDPSQSRVELQVEGAVVESTSVMPNEFYFGNVRAGETRQAEIYLMAFLQDEIEIRSQQLSDPELASQIEVELVPCPKSELPLPDARAGLKLVATLHAGHTLGPIQTWLTVETNLKNVAKLDIPLAANVIGDMSVFGPGWIAKKGMLRMGQVPSEKGKKVRLIVAIRGEHAVTTKLKVETIQPEELRATLEPSRKMSEQLVHVPLVVEIPAGTRTMIRRGERFGEAAEIILSTTHPQTAQFKLQVEFAVHD
ncbi:MAG: DUF1573 domain-containing protein [Pirellulales bacterium]